MPAAAKCPVPGQEGQEEQEEQEEQGRENAGKGREQADRHSEEAEGVALRDAGACGLRSSVGKGGVGCIAVL